MNVDEKTVRAIVAIGKRCKDIQKVSLFGSRARGDNTERSDIDLAVYAENISHEAYAFFCDALDEMGTLLKIDVVLVDGALKEAMRKNIQRDEVILLDTSMTKFQVKLHDFQNAVERLHESIVMFEAMQNTVVRDGAIQRFEFSCELAWKTTREFLVEENFLDLNSPKAVMKQAFAYGLITNEGHWVQLLSDRNATSHIYKEALANEIYERIATIHYAELRTLCERLGA